MIIIIYNIGIKSSNLRKYCSGIIIANFQVNSKGTGLVYQVND